jgi:hypothetical protein
MNNISISAPEIRKALAGHIARENPTPETLQAFLQTDTPVPELIVKADEVIIAYLNANSTPTFGKGARFFLPISKKFGEEGVGEVLGYVEGERAGQPIKKDGLQTGVKSKNATDGIEQAVRGNGESVIIIGGAMTPQKADLLQQKLNELTNGTGDPEALTLIGVKSLLSYSANDLGLNDIWTGKINDVLKAAAVDGHSVTPTGELKQYVGHFVHKPEPGKEVAAVYVKGGASFRGDVAGGLQDYSNAAGFFVTLGVRKNQSQYRGVAEEAFCRDYVNGDNASCNARMLFSVDASTKEVTPPAKSRIGSRADHPAITKFEGGRSA